MSPFSVCFVTVSCIVFCVFYPLSQTPLMLACWNSDSAKFDPLIYLFLSLPGMDENIISLKATGGHYKGKVRNGYIQTCVLRAELSLHL